MKRKREVDYEEEWDDGEESAIELMDILYIVVRRWKLILLILVPFITGGIFYAKTRPIKYSAETTLMISRNRYMGEDSFSPKLMGTYTEIARSKSTMKRVIQKYDLGISADGLAGSILVKPVKDTEFIVISHSGADPAMTAAVTNEIAIEFMKRVKEVMGYDNLNVLEKAEVPRAPLPTQGMKIILFTLIAGVMCGTGIAFLVEFLFGKLRKPTDIKNILGYELLGTVSDFREEK